MAEWIAIVLTLAIALLGVAATYGALGSRMTNAEDRINKHDDQHEDHYKHAAKVDVHWTPRERDDLDKKLDSILQAISDFRDSMYGK